MADRMWQPWDDIICDVCDRRVDRIVVVHEPLTGAVIITAVCHGAREEVRIEEATIAAADRMTFGRAFLRALPAATLEASE